MSVTKNHGQKIIALYIIKYYQYMYVMTKNSINNIK